MGRNSNFQNANNAIDSIFDETIKYRWNILKVDYQLDIFNRTDTFRNLPKYQKEYLLGRIKSELRAIYRMLKYVSNYGETQKAAYIWKDTGEAQIVFSTQEMSDRLHKDTDGKNKIDQY